MAIAKLGVVVLDCPDTRRLAEFYAAVLGWKIDPEGDAEWTELLDPESGRKIAFQESPGFIPPQWPSLDHAQQFHLDFDVARDEIEEAERAVLELGARRVQDSDEDRSWRVYLDPAGHPFCLCLTDRA